MNFGSKNLPALLCLRILMMGYSFTRALILARPSLNRNSASTPYIASPSCLWSKLSDEEVTFDKNSSLTFTADLIISSDPLPDRTTQQEVAVFLLQPEIRNHLVSSGGTRHVREVPRDTEFDVLWNKCCDREYGAENKPEPDDTILVADNVIQFPGLQLTNEVYNGVKRVVDPSTGLPTYKFFLIGEERSISGLPPVVYMFNTLTGANKKKSNSLETQAVAISTFRVTKNGGGSLLFTFEVSFRIVLVFPALLLKILPLSKEKTESQGSASVSHTLSKSVEDSIKSLYDTFLIQNPQRKAKEAQSASVD